MNTTIRQSLLYSVTTIFLVISSIASAAIVATNSFEDNALGALSGQGGGFGWTGNWTAPAGTATVIDTASNPLTYSILGGATLSGATKADLMVCTAAGAGQIMGSRQLITPLTGASFFVSCLMRYDGSAVFDANDTFTCYLSSAAGTTTGNTFNYGPRSSGGTAPVPQFVIRKGTGAPVTGGSINVAGGFPSNQTFFAVAELVWDGTSFSTMRAWLNPAQGDSATPQMTETVAAGTGLTSISHVFFRNFDAGGDGTTGNDSWTVDNIVIAQTWGDLFPPVGPPLAQVGVSTSPTSYIPVTAQNVTAGNSITVYAVALDGSGGYVSNTPATWSFQSPIGGIVGSDIVPSNGGRTAVFTGHRVGQAYLRANPPTGATVYNDSGLITVEAAAPSQVRVETQDNGGGVVVPAQSVAPGGAGALVVYAISRDPYLNYVANISVTWSLANKTGGVVDGDLSPTSGTTTIFTGNLSGTANIRATSAGLASVDSGLITVSRAITWVGGSGNLWDFSTVNWTPDFGATTVRFLDSDDVTFDGSGSASPAVNITTVVSPHSMNVTAGGPYTFGGGGGIAGVGGVTNSSGTRLTFLTTNTYTGPTAVFFGELQLGNGVQSGSLGAGGRVVINTGGTSPIFNRTDSVSAPYVVSNIISGASDFTMDFQSGATELRGSGANTKAKAVVRSGATLILSAAGTSLGAGTVYGGFGATNLLVEAGGVCKLGLPNAAGDHLTSAGRYVYIDGTFDANGVSEVFGILQGNGILDNTGPSNAVFSIYEGNSDVPNGGVGNGGEIYTWPGLIRNTGAGKLGITKISTNTVIFTSANTYGGDTRINGGGVLELGNVNAIQNSTLDRQAGDTGNLSFGSLATANLGGLKGARGVGLTNSSGAAVALTIGGNGQTNTFSGVLSESGSLTKAGNGIQTLSGTNTYAGSTTVSLGTLLVNGGLSGVGGVSVGASGTLGGNGFINGPVGVSGTLRPGNNAIGKLTVNNTATLSGTTVMEISLTTTTNADQLAATTINLGGTMTVTNVGAATLKSGNTFTLFTGSLAGSITPGTFPPLWPGLSWDTSALNSAGKISVAGTPIPPMTTSANISGTNFIVQGTGGLAGATYRLLASTNVALPLASWTPIATNTFSVTGTYSNAVSLTPFVPQRFFAVEVP